MSFLKSYWAWTNAGPTWKKIAGISGPIMVVLIVLSVVFGGNEEDGNGTTAATDVTESGLTEATQTPTQSPTSEPPTSEPPTSEPPTSTTEPDAPTTVAPAPTTAAAPNEDQLEADFAERALGAFGCKALNLLIGWGNGVSAAEAQLMADAFDDCISRLNSLEPVLAAFRQVHDDLVVVEIEIRDFLREGPPPEEPAAASAKRCLRRM